MTSLFIFHRDFRIVDNKALLKVAEISSTIIPIFVFTPEQIDSKKNAYFNDNSVQFMCESLIDLYEACGRKLTFFYGDLVKVLEEIFRKNQEIVNVGFNLDYTKYARDRTEKVRDCCQKYSKQVVNAQDYTLMDMEEVRGDSFYSVFKPYYDRVRAMSRLITVDKRKVGKFGRLARKVKYQVGVDALTRFYTPNEYVQVGGRQNGLAILSSLSKFRTYGRTRNTPSDDTTRLSAHIKFGTLSIREVYWKMKSVSEELLRQLIWHDFYAQLMCHLPYRKTMGGGNFQNKRVKWSTSPNLFEKWCEGRTGFPIVDAGMRQLNTIGWMHNRVRLITSNFLSLVLGIDWRKGEKYFAQKLVDYDPSSNNGNWQFSAQVGIDRVPYVRIYNPFTQAKDVDPQCKYIKMWVPELRRVENSIILNWDKATNDISDQLNYPLPIVDYTKQRKINKKKY